MGDISAYECENQMSLFGDKTFRITNHVRLIELFGGIGAQAAALRNIGADFEHYRMCEIDKFAVKSYNAIHGTNFTPTDIKELTGKDLGIEETDKYTYIMTYSFPCVDLSRAGKSLGMAKGSGTRSGLLWEVERLLKECTELPQVLLMENVPQVHSEKNRADFETWLDFLKGLGYSNFWKDLNAKEYGMAQNRNRCYVVSLLGDYTYTFPDKVPLEKDAYAYLESEVDEKYYLKSETAQKLVDNLEQKSTIARAEQSRAERLSTCQSLAQRQETSLIAYQQEQTEGFHSDPQRELVFMNRKRVDKRNSKLAKTLAHRDYKGFGTGFDTMNGVIEWKRKNEQ